MLRRLFPTRENAPVDDGRRGRPDTTRVSDLAPDEVEALVHRRRVKRRLKALASIGLAAMAGLFLTCAGRTPGARTPPGGGRGPTPSRGIDAGVDAGTPHDAATVDVEQHRVGMPVPDNLLE